MFPGKIWLTRELRKYRLPYIEPKNQFDSFQALPKTNENWGSPNEVARMSSTPRARGFTACLPNPRASSNSFCKRKPKPRKTVETRNKNIDTKTKHKQYLWATETDKQRSLPGWCSAPHVGVGGSAPGDPRRAPKCYAQMLTLPKTTRSRITYARAKSFIQA